jgi:hypothetical protein
VRLNLESTNTINGIARVSLTDNTVCYLSTTLASFGADLLFSSDGRTIGEGVQAHADQPRERVPARPPHRCVDVQSIFHFPSRTELAFSPPLQLLAEGAVYRHIFTAHMLKERSTPTWLSFHKLLTHLARFSLFLSFHLFPLMISVATDRSSLLLDSLCYGHCLWLEASPHALPQLRRPQEGLHLSICSGRDPLPRQLRLGPSQLQRMQLLCQSSRRTRQSRQDRGGSQASRCLSISSKITTRLGRSKQWRQTSCRSAQRPRKSTSRGVASGRSSALLSRQRRTLSSPRRPTPPRRSPLLLQLPHLSVHPPTLAAPTLAFQRIRQSR